MKAHLSKRIFWWFFSLFAFIIASALLIFYAAGYTYDFNTKKIVKTGIVYLTVNPSDNLKITVDGRILATKSPAKIAYLSPGKHDLKIEKDGYNNWEKEYDVKANTVIYEYNVNIFLNKPEQGVLKKDITNYNLNTDKNQIAYSQKGGFYKAKLDKTIKNPEKLSGTLSLNTIWSKNSDTMLYKTDYWYFYNGKSQKTKIPASTSNIMLIDQTAYYIINNVLIAYDTSLNSISKRYSNIFACDYVSQNRLVVSNKEGSKYFLSYLNLSNGKLSQLAQSTYTITEIKRDSNSIVVKDLSQDLYIYKNKDLVKINDNIKFFELSKNTRVFLNTRGKNGIYYVSNLDEMFFYSTDDNKEYFMTRVSGRVDLIIPYLNGDVLIFIEDGNIKTIDGSSVNIYQLGSTNSSVEIINDNLIYIDLNGNLVFATVR